MAVDLTVVQKRATAILGAATQNADGSATYVTTVADDRRHATDIADSATEAVLMIIQAICETPGDGNRAEFMTDSASIPHRGEIPAHYGPIGIPKIQRYAGQDFIAGHQRSAEDIESMRENVQSLYDSVAHNAAGSSLGGYFDVRDNLLFYTGLDAKVPIATFVRADAATKCPDAHEGLAVALTVMLQLKEGDSQILSDYAVQGRAGLEQIRQRAMIEEPQVLAQKAA